MPLRPGDVVIVGSRRPLLNRVYLEGAGERLYDSVGASILKLEEVAIKPLIDISRSSPKLREKRTSLDFLAKVVAVTTKSTAKREVIEAIAVCKWL